MCILEKSGTHTTMLEEYHKDLKPLQNFGSKQNPFDDCTWVIDYSATHCVSVLLLSHEKKLNMRVKP